MLKRNLRFDILTDRRCTVILHHATRLGGRGHGVDASQKCAFRKKV
ncbi:MAG: hypothetical protein WBB28_17695 [Crinalium sp.]